MRLHSLTAQKASYNGTDLRIIERLSDHRNILRRLRHVDMIIAGGQKNRLRFGLPDEKDVMHVFSLVAAELENDDVEPVFSQGNR